MNEVIRDVPLAAIRPDTTVWARTGFDEERVALFMSLFEAGGPEALPPILLVPVDDEYLIGDGWGRTKSAEALRWETIRARVVEPMPGVDAAAFAYELSLKTAATSARPLSRAERQAAIARLIVDGTERTDRQIAELVGVAHTTVGRQRRIALGTGKPGPEAAGEDYLRTVNATDVARRFFKGMEQIYAARGLGIGDAVFGDRTGDRLASLLTNSFGDEALDRAQRYLAWVERALEKLEAEAQP